MPCVKVITNKLFFLIKAFDPGLKLLELDFAVAPGCWLMPSRMVINTESVVGYNNKLKQATQGMKLGVNNNVNLETKKASLRHMDGPVKNKINPPNSHPSNPIHKQATQAQGLAKATPQSPPTPTTPTPTPQPDPTPPQPDSHHVNKALIAGGALALAGVIVWFR